MNRRVSVVLVAVALAVAAGVAYATIPGTDGVIHGCYNKAGVLRVIDPTAGGACASGETALEWNQQGQAGPPGPPGGPAEPADAVDGTIEVTGHNGGAFGIVPILAIGHEIVSPRDAASGLPTGKRQHKPFVITKELDKSTPLLLTALITNENLTTVKVAITDGTSNTVMTIELQNASVASRKQVGETEEVSFTYQKIIWTWVDGGVTAEDDWEAPVS
jgi:type VI secretion system secreted protein Hcp